MSRFSITSLTLLGALLLATPALAQGGAADDRPAGTKDSGVITYDQLQSIQRLMSERYGIVVQYVLPQGWTLVEEGIDPVTGKDLKDRNVYVLLSRRPMPNANDPTDFIFELDIYEHDLLAGLSANATEDQKLAQVDKQAKLFLNTQLSMNNKAGLKTVTKLADIQQPKLYGADGSRPKTAFWPIVYDVPPSGKGSPGARLYTFTSVTNGKLWSLKFLVTRDQVQNYEALIALIVNNAFGLSREQYDHLLANTKKVEERARKAAAQQKQSK